MSRTIASHRKFADFRELGFTQGVVNPVNKSALNSSSFPRKDPLSAVEGWESTTLT
jgi:hypothetical protein